MPYGIGTSVEWYIRNIIIYGEAGETRVVDLEQGVNIISGESQTGKSALINIVDYCLCSGGYRVPVGPIRDFAQWYGVRIQTPHEQVFVARKEPGNNKSTDIMHLLVGKEINLPKGEDLTGNTDRRTVISDLSRRLNIMNYSLAEYPSDVNYTQAPTIRNMTPFLFQPQGLIANQDILFYDTDPVADKDEFRRLQRILPYVLGAIDEEYFVKRRTYDALRAQIRQLKLREEEQAAAIGSTAGVLRDLLTEAAALGFELEDLLSNQDANLDSSHWSLVRESLSKLADEAESLPITAEQNDFHQNSTELIEQSRALREQLQWLRRQYAEAESLELQARNVTETVNVELARMRAVDLFRDLQHRTSNCPLCDQSLDGQAPLVDRVLKIRDDLEAELSNVQLVVPNVNHHLRELANTIQSTRARLQFIEMQVAAESSNFYTTSNFLSEWGLRQQLAGAIRFYLRQTDNLDIYGEDYSDQLAELEGQREELEQELALNETKERMESSLRVVSEYMGRNARQLPLENNDWPLTIDAVNLAVIRHAPTGKQQRMREIGSAANWVSFHLSAMLAFHEFFLENARPVPSFLFLDQPSQAYFPEETWSGIEGEFEIKQTRQTDLENVRQIYNMIFRTVQRLENKLQVILIDHAFLLENEFQNAVRANWRDGRHLI